MVSIIIFHSVWYLLVNEKKQKKQNIYLYIYLNMMRKKIKKTIMFTSNFGYQNDNNYRAFFHIDRWVST